MKKTILMLAALMLMGGAAAAQAANTASTKETVQQSRMKLCAADYRKKGIPASQYHNFMKECLRSKPMGTGTGTSVTPEKKK